MRLRREDSGATVARHGDEVRIGMGGQDVDLTVDDVRWLQAVALPMVLTAVPSEPSDTVGQIEGQLSIEG